LRFANFRLCRLCVWPKYEGLGFNLDASSQPPHLIRLVESHSPAAAGGLKILDVILAVNGRDVSDAFYIDVITAVENARDKSDRIELLVVERRFYDLLKHHHVSFNPKLARKIDTPITMPRDYLNFPKHEPRTCVLRLYRTDRSFGFEVVDGKDAIGSFIQEVDPNSPASKANLRKSDRIIEIDDEFVDDKPSKIILETLAKSKANHTVKLYVVDTNTYEYFQDNEIPLPSKEYQRSSFANKSSVDPHIRKSRSEYYTISKYK
jgi:C-terminal processing protease CtpA/Prc